jgi:hypothetical protein
VLVLCFISFLSIPLTSPLQASAKVQAKKGLPLVVPGPIKAAFEKCLTFLSSFGTRQKNVFREMGNRGRVVELYRQLLLDPKFALKQKEDPLVVAQCVRLMLRRIPETLFTNSRYERLIEAGSLYFFCFSASSFSRFPSLLRISSFLFFVLFFSGQVLVVSTN